ncbi:helix-turn-helix domain-containing protein [Paenibacillus sp. LjRoot56]|uniref:helix-turn-helix domain-containing protein n=1 Tax=Paenibacillus sp. LjRoot56 TaxID=3342333 RepID=UPI003F508CDA
MTYISDIERGERNISLGTLEKVLIALEVNAIEVFRTEGIESIEARTDRKLLTDAFHSLLVGRKLEEVQMRLKVVKEVLGTFDRLEK